MIAISAPALAEVQKIRPLNILHDLPAVADLVEKCFTDTMDAEGRRYIQEMRRVGRDNAFLRWASQAVESTSMPLSGYIWEENGEVIGNVSLIPFHHQRKKIYLIANVAVRENHRRRGIGRALTISAMNHANHRRASETWLHVRDDNPGAISLYSGLGFREQTRRTTWQARPDRNLSFDAKNISISGRFSREWPQQETWLHQGYPDLIDWYQPVPWFSIRPGFGPALYRFFMDYDIRGWSALQAGHPSATLIWQADTGHHDRLWAAAPPTGYDNALSTLLMHARRELTWRQTLTLDYPAGQYKDAIGSAGFRPLRTLLWMKLQSSDFVNNT